MSGSQFSATIDVDPANQSDEDSPENKVLQRAVDERPGRTVEHDRLAVPSTAIADAEDMMKDSVTVIPPLFSLFPVLTSSVHGLR